MSDEFLGVIIENAQNDIRKAGPAAALPALGALAARLGPAIASRLPSLASPKLDALAMGATPIVGPIAPAGLAALRGGQAARLRGKAKVAAGEARAAGEAAKEAGEQAVASYIDTAPKTQGGLADLRTRVAQTGRSMETKPYASRVAEGSMETKVGTSSPTTLASFEQGGAGAQFAEQSANAARLQDQAKELNQASRRMAARTLLPAGTAVGVKTARGSIEDSQTSMNRIDEQTRRLREDKERGTSSASTTSGFGNISSPTPNVQGY